jgi:hypothetical protein
MAVEVTKLLDERVEPGDRTAFARTAFIHILAYEPNGSELQLVEQSLQKLESITLTDAPKSNELAARVALVRALINHNDFVTIR